MADTPERPTVPRAELLAAAMAMATARQHAIEKFLVDAEYVAKGFSKDVLKAKRKCTNNGALWKSLDAVGRNQRRVREEKVSSHVPF